MKYKLFSIVVAVSLLSLFFMGGSGYHMSYYGGPYSYSSAWSGSYWGGYSNYYGGYLPSYRTYSGYGMMSMMGWR